MSHPASARDAHDALQPEALEPEDDVEEGAAADRPPEHAENPGADADDAHHHRPPGTR